MNRTIEEVLPHTDAPLSLPPGATVEAAVGLMNRARAGSVAIVEDDRVVGIFTERDVLRRVVEPARPTSTPLHRVMTRRPATVASSETVRTALARMTSERVRHLPVLDEDDRLVGVVAMTDLVAWITRDLRAEVAELHTYIHGPVHRDRVAV